MARKRLGEILVAAKVIDEHKLRIALAEQRKWGLPLGRILIDLRLISEDILVRALSEQLHIPVAELDKVNIPSDILDLLPVELAQQHNVLPFRRDGRFLDVAMGDPTNLGIIDELRIRTKLDIQPYIAGPQGLEHAIRRWYLVPEPLEGEFSGSVDPATMDLDDTTQRLNSARSDTGAHRSPLLGGGPLNARRAESSWAAGGVEPSLPSSEHLTVTLPAEDPMAPAPMPTRPTARTHAPAPTPAVRVAPAPSRTPAPVAVPNPVPRPTATPAAVPATVHGPSTQPIAVPPGEGPTTRELLAILREREREIVALQKRLATIEQLRSRDEDLIRQICLLLIDKNVLTREEIVKRMNRAG